MAHYKGAASEAGRAIQLMKKREIAQQEIELRKKKIENDLKIHNIESKFATHYNAVEQQLKTSTIGLVTLDEMKAKQENIMKEREKKLAQKEKEKQQEKERALAAKQAEKSKQKKQIQALSFSLDHEEEAGCNTTKDSLTCAELAEEQVSNHQEPCFKKIKKNPDVDTSFLPDREREEEENRLREELRQEWAQKQNALKEEEIDIVFSYWDGSGHRRSVTMKKGITLFHDRALLDVISRENTNDSKDEEILNHPSRARNEDPNQTQTNSNHAKPCHKKKLRGAQDLTVEEVLAQIGDGAESEVDVLDDECEEPVEL